MRTNEPDGPRPQSASWAPKPARPPEALSAVPDVMSLLKALRRRWLFAATAGLIAAGAAATAAWFLTPMPAYTAQTSVRVHAVAPRLIFDTIDNSKAESGYISNQLAMIKSRLVLNKALSQPDVANLLKVQEQVDPVAWLDRELGVTVVGEIVHIGMKGEDPQELAALVNSVTDAYFSEVVEKERERRDKRLTDLKDLYGDYQERLKDKRGELRRLAESAGSKDPDTLAYMHQYAVQRQEIALRELMTHEAELRSARVEAELLEARVAQEGVAAVDKGMIDRAVDQDPEVMALAARVAQLEAGLEQGRRTIRKPSDPYIRGYAAALAEARRDLEARRRALGPAVAEQLRGQGGSAARDALDVLRHRIRLLEGLIEVVRSEAERLDQGSRQQNVTSLDIDAIQDEIKQADAAGTRIGAEVEHLDVEIKAQEAQPRVELIEKAEVPKLRSEGKQAKMAGLSGAGALAAVLFGVAWLEFQRRRVHSVDEVVQGLGIPMLGSLPAVPSRGRLRGGDDPKSFALHGVLVESIDSVRSLVLRDSRGQPLKTLMVASALGGEGKTSLASHLALSFARAGRRTLLIDCDLRRPMAHQLFDLPAGPGVCEVLRGEVALRDAIQPTTIGNLSLIGAGHCNPMALQSLAGGGLGPIFVELKEGFDFVLVDTAPVLPVADSLEVSQHVDAVLFSVMSSVSRMPCVYAAYERLNALGVRMLGAVVAGTPIEGRGDVRYGYGYGYGYGYARAAPQVQPVLEVGGDAATAPR